MRTLLEFTVCALEPSYLANKKQAQEAAVTAAQKKNKKKKGKKATEIDETPIMELLI